MKPNPVSKSEHVLFGLLTVMMVGTFAADLLTPLGIVVWVIYLFPTALAAFAWRPQVPLLTAATAILLIVVGFFFSAPGADTFIALLNRSFGVVTASVIGITGYYFIKSKVAIRTQEWLQSGQVALSKAMSGDPNFEELGSNILRFLTDYLGAQAGAIFVRNGNGFSRSALHGAPAQSQIPTRFDVGDGLLGQAVKDDRSMLLRDVPEGYLYFGSGLALGKPRHLLIATSKADGEVNTVIELGFIGGAQDIATEFMERVSQSIGTAVRSVKYRMRQQELLEESQQQAEELQTQGEELRASNEELEQQGRALQDSQKRLEVQQAELEQTNSQLEEQTQLLGRQKDDLNRAQSTLQTKAQDLEQASRYKSEFIANMSHELRTPLNSLLIMARLLGDNRHGNLTTEQVKYAQTIEGAGNDLLTLINDILDISKIEAGRLEIQAKRVRVPTVIESLRKEFELVAKEKHIDLKFEVDADAPAELEIDALRLQQILKNFLSNALKFTQQGEVVLAVRGLADGRMAFAVRDTGIGIAAEQHKAIFEAFRQADGTINRKFGGTGLGLSISSELARLLGGTIKVESTADRGSTFTLEVPLVYQAEAVQARVIGGSEGSFILKRDMPQSRNTQSRSSASERPVVLAAVRRTTQVDDDRESLVGSKRTILVVEDDEAFAGILYDLSHELGFQCLVAGSADEGVLMARQYLPHALVLDLGLPDHTGLSVLDRLKRDPRTRHIPIHVASVEDYTQAALELGAMSYMLKPVRRERLVQALEGLETRLAQPLRRVLIVEDDATQLDSIRSLLASRDVETVGVKAAAECLELLRTETFDCMVLDLSLPDVSGYELLEQLSQNEAFSFPPVIVYTGRDLVPRQHKLARFR